jgi:hypothetical protein
MREVLILAIHLLVTLAKLLCAGGVRAVAAESLLLKHQLLITNRSCWWRIDFQAAIGVWNSPRQWGRHA